MAPSDSLGSRSPETAKQGSAQSFLTALRTGRAGSGRAIQTTEPSSAKAWSGATGTSPKDSLAAAGSATAAVGVWLGHLHDGCGDKDHEPNDSLAVANERDAREPSHGDQRSHEEVHE